MSNSENREPKIQKQSRLIQPRRNEMNPLQERPVHEQFGRLIVIVLIAILLMWLVVEPGETLAGPGGQFVKSITKSPLGKVVLGIVAVILLPLIIYVVVREAMGVRQTKRDLKELAEQYPYFHWNDIERKTYEAVTRIYEVWTSGKLLSVSHFMTRDFGLSQQEMLDRWYEEGKRNVVSLKDINKIKPLHVTVENEDSYSSVRILVNVKIVDYLENVSTGKIIKGRKKVDDSFETIWVMTYEEGAWRVSAIEEGDNSLDLATTDNQLDTSFLDRMARTTPSQAPAFETPLDRPATHIEQPGIQVPADDDDERKVEHPDKRLPEQR